MAAYLITTQEEFITNYFYGEIKALENLPDEYPFILLTSLKHGGISGSHVEHEIVKFPENIISQSDYFEGFLIGLKARE